MAATTAAADLLTVRFLDLTDWDLGRIARLLNDHGFACDDKLARQLFDACAPLPDRDEDGKEHELFWRLAPHLRIDWGPHAGKLEEILRSLESEWKADDSPKAREQTERRMLVVTNGLDEHPEWWDYSCICDECRASA